MSKKVILGILLIALITVLTSQFSHFLTLENVKSQQEALSLYIDEHLFSAAALYFLFYVLITAFSLPGAAVITLLGGALFGFWLSVLLVSFASSLGATLAFLSARYLLRSWVEKRFNNKMAVINKGLEEQGGYYLFSLRLIPVLPFFVINLLMGLTKLPVGRFYLVSQLGMLPGTAVYLNAGTQLASIDSLSGIVSPAVIFSFVLLGLFPLLIKFLLNKFTLTKKTG